MEELFLSIIQEDFLYLFLQLGEKINMKLLKATMFNMDKPNKNGRYYSREGIPSA